MPAPRRSTALRRLSLGAFALLVAILIVPSAASAATRIGSVYTQTNSPGQNQIVVFDRYSDGTIVEVARVNTGGHGSPSPDCATPPAGPAFNTSCPIIDSQGSVVANSTGTLLFAVNAGSDTVSAFKIDINGIPHLVGTVPSGGHFPISLTIHNNVLYVLNERSGNIQGYTFTSSGQLTPIPGSNQPLSTHGAVGAAAQISFDTLGRNLIVTERNANVIDVFRVTNNVPGPAVAHPVAPGATTPFGFAVDPLNHLIVSDALSQVDGAATSYNLDSSTGAVTPINTQTSGGGAPCWVVVTPNGRFAFITNTTTKSIARYSVATDGTLTFLGTVATTRVPPGLSPQFPTDEALSPDGRFLYVLVPSVFSGDVSRIDVYKVGTDGSLTLIQQSPEDMPPGTSGLAVV
jgi:6-phosphogluconolactonase (cycloisomerase 2 family)